MKKILLIAYSDMSLSGVPVVYMSIVRQLHNDCMFDLIILKSDDMFFQNEFLSYGGKIYLFDSPKPNNLLKRTYWMFKGRSKGFLKFLNKQSIDLKSYDAIHSFDEIYSYDYFKIAKKCGVKNLILHINSAASAYPHIKSLKQKIVDYYQKKAKKICSDIIFVSNASLRLNNYKNKGQVIYNIYDEKKYGEIINCQHNTLVLSQIGTLSKRKNQLFTLEVLLKLKESYPGVILNIVGKELDKGYLHSLEHFIQTNDLSKNVVFYEPSADRKLLTENTSYVLFPSTQESFGLVLIESQATGVHCFASENIPNDADMGNVEFLKLNTKIWADRIVEYFNKNGNSRINPQHIDRFSSKTFRQKLLNLYSK